MGRRHAGAKTQNTRWLRSGNPFPQNGKAVFPMAGVYVNVPLNPKRTYVARWNVTYQRQFGNWLASTSFLGKAL
jgi:hypothetical protein